MVAQEGADLERIEEEIKSMPAYFDEYDTIVHFISNDEMKKNHSELPHGGFVIRSGKSGEGNSHNHTIEYKLTLDSNPEFTAGVLIAAARAVYKKHKRGETGCITLFDVSPADLSQKPRDGLLKSLL